MRVAPAITLSEEDRKVLESWSRGRSTPARLVQRARIVLLGTRGMENIEIAAEVWTDRQTVGRWRTRFVREGLEGIRKDRPRGGRKATKRQSLAQRIIHKTTQEKPGIRRGSCDSVRMLINAITAFIDGHNADPKPFIWTAGVQGILEKVRRARAALDRVESV